MSRDFVQEASDALSLYRDEESKTMPESQTKHLDRILAEAQVLATLAVATELERHRIAGWGQSR